MLPDVVDACPDCNKFKAIAHRPKAGAELAGWFNDFVVVDLFYLWDKIWLMAIDEATRYKIAAFLKDKYGRTIMRALLRDWIRYFGPMKHLVSDQEGGIAAEDFGLTVERYSITLLLKGSDPAGRHTGTGLAEKHIHLTKAAALKLKSKCQRQNESDSPLVS